MAEIKIDALDKIDASDAANAEKNILIEYYKTEIIQHEKPLLFMGTMLLCVVVFGPLAFGFSYSHNESDKRLVVVFYRLTIFFGFWLAFASIAWTRSIHVFMRHLKHTVLPRCYLHTHEWLIIGAFIFMSGGILQAVLPAVCSKTDVLGQWVGVMLMICSIIPSLLGLETIIDFVRERMSSIGN
jgi:hypothetical protein